MNLFYTTDISGQRASLPEEEARHCVQVLRQREGDVVRFTDGKGGWYRGQIVEAGKKHCVLQILEAEQEYGKRPYAVHLAIAPTKNNSRVEWLLEKAAEVGIERVTPLLCEHSERRVLKPARLEKILLSATKQSLKAYLPQLDPLTDFDTFLKQPAGGGQRFMAYLGDGVKGNLKDNYEPGRDVCIMVGPEGGFSAAEAGRAQQAGFTPVRLGESRLRTETAGLIACHSIHLLNQ